MTKPIVSLICTVLNEEKTIKDFLNSILNQTFLPDEIIIVDGGSKDKTFEILREYEKKYPNLIRIYQLRGANIAQGRNFAIRNANGIIIVTTDAGCMYDRNFVREIVKPLLKFLLEYPEKFNLRKEEAVEYIRRKGLNLEELKNEECAEFVQGVYLPYYQTDFEYFAGFMLVKSPRKQYLVPTRMSARCTAYFKYVWENAGGYPEKYVTGEDTLFNIRVLKKGYKITMKENAICYWRMPSNLVEFFKKFKKYGTGDAIQGNIFRNKRLLLFYVGFWVYLCLLIIFPLFNRTLFMILILLLLSWLLFLSLLGYIKTRRLEAIFYFPFLDITRKVAYVVGVTKGLLYMQK